jgi:hypothetical protein
MRLHLTGAVSLRGLERDSPWSKTVDVGRGPSELPQTPVLLNQPWIRSRSSPRSLNHITVREVVGQREYFPGKLIAE